MMISQAGYDDLEGNISNSCMGAFLKCNELMLHLHFLLTFQGLNIDAEFLDAMPEAALVDTEYLGCLDLDASGTVQRLDNETLFNLFQPFVDA